MSKITPTHIIAIGLLVLAVSCSAGALLALVFSALQLFPAPMALVLFRECIGVVFASAVLTVRRLRH